MTNKLIKGSRILNPIPCKKQFMDYTIHIRDALEAICWTFFFCIEQMNNVNEVLRWISSADWLNIEFLVSIFIAFNDYKGKIKIKKLLNTWLNHSHSHT